MGLKENLKTKIHLDSLLRKVVYTIKEPPQTRWVDKELVREILDKTDFEYKKAGNLHLYIRPLADEIMEVLVLDNELPIYHTTVADVALRKSPHWQDVFSIKNIKKIMNDQDVIASKGKDSFQRLYENALGRLDLAHTRDDLAQLIEDARRGLEQRSVEQIKETLDLFFELLGFQPVYFELLEPDLHMFGRPGPGSAAFDHLIILNEATLSLGLRKGPFSTTNDLDVAWVSRYAEGLETADLRGIDVFEFLAKLALGQEQYLPHHSGELLDELPAS